MPRTFPVIGGDNKKNIPALRAAGMLKKKPKAKPKRSAADKKQASSATAKIRASRAKRKAKEAAKKKASLDKIKKGMKR